MDLRWKINEGGGHNEHVVPLVFLRDESRKMFKAGATVEDVARYLEKFLKVVEITVEEAVSLRSHEAVHAV